MGKTKSECRYILQTPDIRKNYFILHQCPKDILRAYLIHLNATLDDFRRVEVLDCGEHKAWLKVDPMKFKYIGQDKVRELYENGLVENKEVAPKKARKSRAVSEYPGVAYVGRAKFNSMAAFYSKGYVSVWNVDRPVTKV